MMLFSKPPHERDPKKMKSAIQFLRKIKFFAQREIEEEDYLLLANSMSHEYFTKGKIVYNEGEFGDEFYIILMGDVTVFTKESTDEISMSDPMGKQKKYGGKIYDKAREELKNKYEFMTMQPGEAFGQTAILQDKPHSESILCTTNCHFAILSKKNFERILKLIEMKTKDGWKIFFKSHPIFDSLTLVSLRKLFYLIELKIYSRNQHIYKAGDEVNGFFLIYNGEVSLSTKIEQKVKEKLDINTFIKKKNEIKKNDSHDFQSLYHSTVNQSKGVHNYSKDLELRIQGEGQLLGLEDSLLKRSKNTVNHFTHTAT